MKYSKLKDFIKLFIFILCLASTIITIVSSKDFLSKYIFGITPELRSKQSDKTLFKKKKTIYAYSEEAIKVNSHYVFKFKDILATSSNNSKKHFLVDLSIYVDDEEIVKNLENNSNLIITVIKETLANFTFEDIKLDKGKIYLKETLKKNIEEKIGRNKISKLYIESIVYN
jgi:flagellar basal body-associated protein FliL